MGRPLLNMRFFKFNGIPQRSRRNQIVRKGTQLITLQNCSTAVLQYCSTEVLQFCNTAILQYWRTAIDYGLFFLSSVAGALMNFCKKYRKGGPLVNWEEPLGGLGIPLKWKIGMGGSLLNIRFSKFDRIPYRSRGNQTVRKGTQLITLHNCSTTVLKYCSTAIL